MFKVLLALLLVLTFALSGCGEGGIAGWLKSGKPKAEVKSEVEEVEGTVLASVNGTIITLEDFNARIDAVNKEIRASEDIPDSVKSNYLITSAEDKKKILESMVERKLLVAEAIDRGLDQDEDFKQAMKALREELLFAKIIESEKAKASITTKEVENFYNINKQAFAIPEERKVSMMVMPSEDKAKEVLIVLLQGGDFGALARVNSKDKSATSGGDIGFIVKKLPFPQPDKKTMFEKFEQVAFSLELNKPSTIFKGPDGFYIIKVAEIKESRQMLLSEVFKDIEQGLLLRKQDDTLKNLIEGLRRAGNIIIHDELLKE
ncbi:MAG: peptidylprolyl isomerase [Candidatus Omnitrophica bacterium]|nr:peptidylprolyl isomerase [Candidatus Omnitrophota bacterium]